MQDANMEIEHEDIEVNLYVNILMYYITFYIFHFINPLTPNDPYRRRTAPLTSKVAFYIFIHQI